MKMNDEILKKYAHLAVVQGANVQKDQLVVINTSVEHNDFTRLVVEEVFKAGGRDVVINYVDSEIEKMRYENVETDVLKKVPQWSIDKYKYVIDEKTCFIHIISTTPDLLKDISPDKLQTVALEKSKALAPFRYYTMADHGQWTIVAVPNEIWAHKVFPNDTTEVALEKLWDAILKCVYVDANSNPVENWQQHNQQLKGYVTKMNESQFESLHFTNALGTDLTVALPKNHIWAGGGATTIGGVAFNPNMPTEEVFTAPHKKGVNGIVYATKPLNVNGKVVDGFSVEFKDGKAVSVKASVNEDVLVNLLKTDEGASYLGEVALVSYNTPISQSGILFYDTLFDENASCHLAFGAAYPTSVLNGATFSPEEVEAAGLNTSMIHVDFMFGSADMKIEGISKDDSKTILFENGNFVI